MTMKRGNLGGPCSLLHTVGHGDTGTAHHDVSTAPGTWLELRYGLHQITVSDHQRIPAVDCLALFLDGFPQYHDHKAFRLRN
jgi:hypothetical protein